MIADQYATKAEAARLLGVSSPTIWRWVKIGKLTAERIGREVLIPREELTTVSKDPRGRKPKPSRV